MSIHRAAALAPARLLLAWLLLLAGVAGCIQGQSFVEESPGGSVPPPSSSDGGPTPNPDGQEQEAPAAGTVRIAAFNVHRFFDTVCQSGTCGGTAYEELPSPEAFASKADRLARAITSLKAGVVLLAEVETQPCLDAIQTRLPGFSSAVLGELGTPASVDVAVLARFPVREVRSHRASHPLTRPDGTTTRFSRELLEVRLDVEGTETIVFASHFRSKVDDDPGRRYAEAEAAREIITAVAAERPGALVVLGGDLNDVPGSAPLEALEQDGALHRVSSDRPPEETGTVWYRGVREPIDHLYQARDAAGRYVPGSFRVVGDTAVSGLGGSDHAAVRADFELPRP
ncbi:endonuclease/exonuclease/phosphatase family protein [Hyalangium rubrum]|uniref:Endonuclease/exonuclease/phosphatase family protein n=1 Tax=Hyalangium rubrum TaxID=3103134 RepID=A0ABU5H7E7_9BACT|nr:endonuclease/exonuclease/phosphatase family protein [Hyalangium sp. s54d21]MDY7229385.1 endonuclease/exonuclease/phosphatase family protein [Hyalangium sp. s54d21]